jgi:pyridoxamine 5'-phosphate oxidase
LCNTNILCYYFNTKGLGVGIIFCGPIGKIFLLRIGRDFNDRKRLEILAHSLFLLRSQRLKMNNTQILEFLNLNPICFLATVDEDQPKVRCMVMYKADHNGLVFYTGDFKELYKQLQANPKVEICFISSDQRKQIRVCGEAEFLEELSIKEEIVNAHPFLKPRIQKQGLEQLIVFRVKHCKAALWSMATNFEPNAYIDLETPPAQVQS